MRGATSGLLRCDGRIHISIHAPLAGCDRPYGVTPWKYRRFQSTHPLRGATSWSSKKSMPRTISIHAPLAGCDCAIQNARLTVLISIHAPLAGCDLACCRSLPPAPGFQSTHPLRGATASGTGGRRGDAISIHAPLAGCDPTNESAFVWYVHFNPRTPCGVRPHPRIRICVVCAFQSTHPLRGATPTPTARSSRAMNFNPRTPCGVRQISCARLHRPAPFQSTHPLRGATTLMLLRTVLRHISIHAPLAGCDNTGAGRRFGMTYFNPRTPCGVRP